MSKPYADEWRVTRDLFDRLLGWLDRGHDSHGQKYEEMRRRLISYFARKNCPVPEDLADETIIRVVRWLADKDIEVDIEPAKFLYATARFVFLEGLRDPERSVGCGMPPSQELIEDPNTEDPNTREIWLDCLERCVNKLPANERDLIMQYYDGTQRDKLNNREALAIKHGIPINVLRVKAYRIRQRLQGCVAKCADESNRH